MYEEIILEIYRKCDIHSFPIDCDRILTAFGYRIKTYVEASRTTQQLRTLHSYSGDAFTDHSRKIIYYNDSVSPRRTRFSKMHELGHIVLETDDDDAADSFASNFLAPRPIIFSRQLNTADKISRTFDISIAAANNALIGKAYAPDGARMELIDYFGERSWCPWPFNQPPVMTDIPSKPDIVKPKRIRLAHGAVMIIGQEEPSPATCDPDIPENEMSSGADAEKAAEIERLEEEWRKIHLKIQRIDVCSEGYEKKYEKYRKELLKAERSLDYLRGTESINE